jgi:hypothetical protein
MMVTPAEVVHNTSSKFVQSLVDIKTVGIPLNWDGQLAMFERAAVIIKIQEDLLDSLVRQNMELTEVSKKAISKIV